MDAAAEAAVRAVSSAFLAATAPSQVARVLGALAGAVGLDGGGGWTEETHAAGEKGDTTTAPSSSLRPASISRAAVEEVITTAVAALAELRAVAEGEARKKSSSSATLLADAAAASALVVAALHRGGRYASLADGLLSGKDEREREGEREVLGPRQTRNSFATFS